MPTNCDENARFMEDRKHSLLIFWASVAPLINTVDWLGQVGIGRLIFPVVV